MLKIMWSVAPPTLDPDKAGPSYFHYLLPVYDTLLTLSSDGAADPLLASG
jgi:hypothetical protein